MSTFTDTLASSATDISSCTSLSVLSNSIANETNPEHARIMIEKQQLIHQCEMMKIEISQKNNHIQDLQAQHEARLEELEEHLHASRHTQQLLQYKLNSAVSQHGKELQASQMANSDQISKLRQRQAEVESLLPNLQVRAAELRNLLLNIHITHAQYAKLNEIPREDLSIKDLILVSFYESQLPLHKNITTLKNKLKSYDKQIEVTKTEVANLEAVASSEKQSRVVTESENIKIIQQMDLLKQKLDPSHKANYNKLLEANTEYETHNKQLVTANTYMKADMGCLKEDLKKTDAQHAAIKQEVALLNQDKQYLAKENTELLSRVHRAEQKLDSTVIELNNTKAARDKVFEQLVNAKHDSARDTDNKLQYELDNIRHRTEQDLQHLKDSSVQVYEREKKLLLDAKESALADRNDALRQYRELQAKYNDLSDSYRGYQASSDSGISNYKNEIKLKQFECERLHIVHEELSKKYSASAKDNDRISKKLEVLIEDYNEKKVDYTTQLGRLELKSKTLEGKLIGYESVEQELETLLLNTADTTTIPKQHLKQSVNLAKKVMELSKCNDVLKMSLKEESKRLEKALGDLEILRSQLHHSNQPSGYLVESIKKRDSQITVLKNELARVCGELINVKALNKELVIEKDRLSLDIERLLKNKENYSDLKKMIEEKVTNRKDPKPMIFTK